MAAFRARRLDPVRAAGGEPSWVEGAAWTRDEAAGLRSYSPVRDQSSSIVAGRPLQGRAGCGRGASCNKRGCHRRVRDWRRRASQPREGGSPSPAAVTQLSAATTRGYEPSIYASQGRARCGSGLSLMFAVAALRRARAPLKPPARDRARLQVHVDVLHSAATSAYCTSSAVARGGSLIARDAPVHRAGGAEDGSARGQPA